MNLNVKRINYEHQFYYKNRKSKHYIIVCFVDPSNEEDVSNC